MKIKLVLYSIIAALMVIGSYFVLSSESRHAMEVPTSIAGQAGTDTSTSSVKTYHNDAEGIEFKYPSNLTIGGGSDTYNPTLYITRLYYGTRTAVAGLTIASTTVTDITKLQFDYEKGLSKDNPKFDSVSFSPDIKPTIESSEMITVDGKSALKEIVNDNDPYYPSISTWIQVISNKKLYSFKAGVNHGYDNSIYAATPADEAKAQEYLDLFLSSVKFF